MHEKDIHSYSSILPLHYGFFALDQQLMLDFLTYRHSAGKERKSPFRNPFCMNFLSSLALWSRGQGGPQRRKTMILNTVPGQSIYDFYDGSGVLESETTTRPILRRFLARTRSV